MKKILSYILGAIIIFITYIPALPLAYLYAIHYAAIRIVKSARLDQ